jgi:hypothetical protein
MNGMYLYNAIGDIDGRYVEDADTTRGKAARAASPAVWRRSVMPVAACLIVAIGVFYIYNTLNPSNRSTGDETGGQSYVAGGGANTNVHDPENEPVRAGGAGASDDIVGKPPLTIEGPSSEACYVDPDDWRGLPAEDFVLEEQTEGDVAGDRMVFQTLGDLSDHADAFIVVPNVHEIAPDGDNMQSAIAEYSEAIGAALQTRQWDDYTVSTGSRILIRQTLIGGCTMDEPNNLLRVGGVYLLPVKFNPYWGTYEVVGDLDVLFELDGEGKIVSHSRFPELNQYDGKPFSELLNAVRALYPIL